MFITVKGESSLISAHRQPEYDNKYEVKNAIGVYHVRFVECNVKCLSDTRCLSFFLQQPEKSVYFTFRSLHLLRDVLLRKRVEILPFTRTELDLCYKLEPPIKISTVDEDSICQGSEIMRIDSSARQDYIKLVTADIGGVYNQAICIQGKRYKENGFTTMDLQWSFLVATRSTKRKF
ncbi:unnamed protein product [Mytilus edulis]|uniref:Uncharacterized protein n=1 Tax=Mytilus edulis TaxID=6550 RepID=A0A8S3Q6A5_MYTED|nr:unnamed protein product [Mytilus edulis]